MIDSFSRLITGALCLSLWLNVANAAGVPCTIGGMPCANGTCVDGYCCDTPCTAVCAACNVMGMEGTCSPVTGAPVGGRTQCVTDGSNCGGSCDGMNTAACAYPNQSTTCHPSSCTNGVASIVAVCDGKGGCPAAEMLPCAPYACNGTGCGFLCAGDSDCSASSYCDANSCLPQEKQGASCAANDECASGYCVDGYCCDTACAGVCAACNVMGKEGTCVAQTGAPAKEHGACAGSGTCAGVCDGTQTDACAFPTVYVVCGAASCSGGIASGSPTCDGKGGCVAGATHACELGCNGLVCATPDMAMEMDMAVGKLGPPTDGACSVDNSGRRESRGVGILMLLIGYLLVRRTIRGEVSDEA